MNRMAWLAVGILALGCGQGGATPDPVRGRAEPLRALAPAVPPPVRVAAAVPKPECGCHGDHAADPRTESVDVSRLDVAHAPAKGRDGAAVTMLVFCDFQCPYCKKADRTLAELEQSYGDDLRIVWKQLPLPMHDDARMYAKASFAAQDQGKFWPMHDLLLHTEGLEPSGLDGLATSLGLDLTRFHTALGDPSMEKRLERELDDASSVGANGTPTFVINGKKIVGAQPLGTFTKLIDEALGTPL